jgi:DNA processing protein
MTGGSRLGERTAWVALASVSGVGDVIFALLVARHGGAAQALGAVRDRTERLRMDDGRSMPATVRSEIHAAARDPTAIQRRLDELGVWTLTPMDPAYPARMAVLDPLPPVLFGWGAIDALEAERSVAVVGTRRPTVVGRSLAARITTRLVEAGAVVVSGLAIGVDGAAHAAAVAAGGRTVAVIGGGHAQPGPTAHRGLIKAILAQGGAVVGELPPDAKPSRGTFPRRNRIISALADATIVVEAPARSGALITARHALEQGRTLLVAPGRPGDRVVAGCLALLRETPARPLVGLDELVVDLGWSEPSESAGRLAAVSLASALALVGPAERAVAQRLALGPVGADALVADTGLPPAVVSGAMTLLLLRGWAQVMGPAYLPAGPLLRGNDR